MSFAIRGSLLRRNSTPKPALAKTPSGGKLADFAQIAVSVVEQAIGDVLKSAERKNHATPNRRDL
jgi:hypothetical protein